MSKHLSPSVFYDLPSGNRVHPWRLIHKDGTIMWKHALQDSAGNLSIPTDLAHESHIIKTAQRIEELNSWVSQSLEPWDCLTPKIWYVSNHEHKPFAEGYACCFTHVSLPIKELFEKLKPHVHSHEEIKSDESTIYFRRC